MPITDSPLRYPGGKSKIKKSVESLIIKNRMHGGTYVEPFAGGSAVALHLIFSEKVNRIIINDYDISIYAFWYSVLNFSEELCDLIRNTEITIDEWYRQRRIQNNKLESKNMLELGFSTFFLNRTNRSGIIKAGVMGGKAQLGKYKMDCRYNKEDLINKIIKINSYRDSIQLYNLDAIDLIRGVINNLDDNTLIFFDPPYYEKGQSLYVNFYNHIDHEELANEISGINGKKWIVSYDNVEEINNMYNQFRKIEYNLNYTVQNKYAGKEVMFFSDNIIPLRKL